MDEWDAYKSRVKEASDIVDVVGERLTLKRKGREFAGLCPFHDDHNPSMAVIPGKQIFHCFVCGAGGDVLTFVQQYHGVEFAEALKMLADRAGIEPPRRRSAPRPSGEAEPADVRRSDVIEANRRALAYFRAILQHPEHGAAARAVVERRGISAAMVERFALGAAADRWDGLRTMADRGGWDGRALLAAGLLKRKDDDGGRVYDALRNRLIFPILGESGEPIAFGARRIDDADEPKYLNSPDTGAFRKSTALFGLPLARAAIRQNDAAVVVEGYTDVIACHQAGVEHVVGTLGTAFTAEHARKLRGLASRIVLLFDGDEAGQLAADRAFEVLLTAKVDVAVATLRGVTDAKDPDELLKRDGGRELLCRALDNAQHISDFRGRRLAARLRDADPARKARLLDEEMARLAALGLDALSPVERRVQIERLAAAAGVPFEDVLRSMPAGRRPRAHADARTVEPARDLSSCRLSDEEYAIACALAEPGLAPRLRAIAPSTPDDPRVAVILGSLLAGGVGVSFEDPAVAAAAAALHRRAAAAAGDGKGAVGDLFEETAARIGRTRASAGERGSSPAERLEAMRARSRAGQPGPAGVPWGRRKPPA